MNTKTERGSLLIEALVVLALMSVLAAMVGQSLQSVLQGKNEANISAALLALQTAEQNYASSYGAYATGSTLTDLSTCPAPGVHPSAAAACLIPPAYTSGAAVYGYTITLTTPTDAPACTTAPCGFLAVAFPTKPANGRYLYCVTSLGVLNGELTKTEPTVTTDAECSALPAIQAGTPASIPVPAVAIQTLSTSGGEITGTGPIGTGGSVTIPMTLPSAAWDVTAVMTLPSMVGTGQLNPPLCSLLAGSTTLDSVVATSVPFMGVGNTSSFRLSLFGTTPAATTSVSVVCTDPNGTTPAWTLHVTAIQATTVSSQT
jgi:type II secretory pathway pseudopilin PulG